MMSWSSSMKIWKIELKNLGGTFEIDNVKKESDKLEEESASQSFWDDNQKAQEILQELSQLKETLQKY